MDSGDYPALGPPCARTRFIWVKSGARALGG
jgi:hypothetical protein